MDQNNELQLPIDLIETITDDKLRNNVTLDLSQRITAPVGDIKEIMDHANTILSSTYRFNNATSFKDISSRLTKEKLNTESKVITIAATDSAVSTEIKPDEDYVGLSSVEVNVKPLQNLIVPRIIPENFKYIPDDSAELETIYLKSTNATSSTTIGITITTDNPTEYSGLNKVTITDIGILQNQKFTVSKEHLISSNTFKLVFADDEHFGTSDVDITVPLIKNKRFSVNKNTIGRTYVPAEGDLALDGTTLTDTAPAIGFESVTLDADIAPGVTAAKLKELAASQGGTIISPGGTALGYESVEIPKLETLTAATIKSLVTAGQGGTTIKPSAEYLGYKSVEIPKLKDLESSDILYNILQNSTNTTLVPDDPYIGYSEIQLPGYFDLQVKAAGVSSAITSGANYLYISRNQISGTEPYRVLGVTIDSEDNIYFSSSNEISSSYVNVTAGSSNNGMLRDLFVALPQLPQPSSDTETELVMFLVHSSFSSGSLELNVYDDINNSEVTRNALASSSITYQLQLDESGERYETVDGTYYLYYIPKNSNVDISLYTTYSCSTMELYIQQVRQKTSTESTNYVVTHNSCIGVYSDTNSLPGTLAGSFNPISDTTVIGSFNNSVLNETFGTFDLSEAKIYDVFGLII